MSKRFRLLAGTSSMGTIGVAGLCALATLGAATTAMAADGATVSNRVEDIVVTARKQAENLQEVPTAITALSAQTLEDLQINSFQDVGKTVPNVLIQKQAGSPTAPQFNIRGISAGSIDFQVDSGVALYVDGVYLGRPGNSGFDLADLERLEVLRGPQGTLFGRNSTGGAISFTTAGPTGELGAIVEGTLGNYDRRRGRITINTPEWNGLSARLTYVHDENEGSVRNSAPTRRTFLYPAPFGSNKAAKTFGANNTDSVLGSVRYTGIDNLTLDYKFDYTNLVTTIDGMQLLVPGSLAGILAGQPALGGTNVSGLDRLKELPLDGIAPAHQTTWGHSLTGVYEFNDQISLKYIGAVRGFKVNTQSELDGNYMFDPNGSGNPYQRLAAVRYAKQRQWSHEVQLLGKSDRVDWVAGVFYFREKAYLDSPVAFGQSAPDGALIPVTNPGSYLAGGKLQRILNKSIATYAHANYHITDELELGGGLRYSLDKRTENDLLADNRVPPRGKRSASQDRLDYDVSLKYQFAENSNIYAKFVTGFVSGGVFNSVEFKPETIKSYEAGLKSEWFDRRVRLNLAVFQADRKNRQVTSFIVGPGTVLINSGGDRARGVELETTVVPVDGLTLTGNYGFTDVNTSTGVRTDQPRHSAYLAAQYEFPAIGEMQPSFRVDGQYIGRHSRLRCPYGSTTSDVVGCTNLQAVDPVIDRALSLDPSWQIGARFTLADIPLGGTRGSVSVWGKNLNNSHEYEYLFSIGSPVLGTFQQPRTYGVDLKMEF